MSIYKPQSTSKNSNLIFLTAFSVRKDKDKNKIEIKLYKNKADLETIKKIEKHNKHSYENIYTYYYLDYIIRQKKITER